MKLNLTQRNQIYRLERELFYNSDMTHLSRNKNIQNSQKLEKVEKIEQVIDKEYTLRLSHD